MILRSIPVQIPFGNLRSPENSARNKTLFFNALSLIPQVFSVDL